MEQNFLTDFLVTAEFDNGLRLQNNTNVMLETSRDDDHGLPPSAGLSKH